MNLVHLVETFIQKRLILPGIGDLLNVALFDLYVMKYNSGNISDVRSTVTQYLWLVKSDQNKRND